VSTGPFSILTVCTGNICRSPLAEQLLRARLDGDRFTVSSAGTAAMVDWTMDDDAAAQSRQRGGDPDGFLARQLTRDLAEDADLILTATVAHRDDIIAAYPRVAKRTFSLAEFAAIGLESVAQAARARVDVAASSDVVDPYGRSRKVHKRSAQQTDDYTAEIARILSA